MWEKIVLNLLSNAFKFTFEGRSRSACAAATANAVLEVHRHRHRHPAAELPRVFERFHRVEGRGPHARRHGHRPRAGAGAGEAARRRRQVESAEGHGTRSSHRAARDGAPARRADRAASALADDRAGAEPFVEEALRWLPTVRPPTRSRRRTATREPRARISGRDDNADMRDYVRRLLARTYDVEAVPTARRRWRPRARAARSRAHRRHDAGARRLRAPARAARRPACATSGDLALGARRRRGAHRGARAGADDYLVKPFSARELLARIDSRLRSRGSARGPRPTREREDALRASDRKKDEFLALLSHELRNPLAPLLQRPPSSCAFCPRGQTTPGRITT